MKQQSSFPILGILGLIFITLKLTHVIDWSWLWVLAPFWGAAALILAIFLVGAVFMGIGYLLTSEEERKRQRIAKAAADLAARLRR